MKQIVVLLVLAPVGAAAFGAELSGDRRVRAPGRIPGKIVMLDFWATSCQPCRHELPVIEALSRKYKERNVIVLGINDEDLSTPVL